MLRSLLALLALTAAAADASAQARTVRLPSAVLGSERIFSVLLPAGYADSERRYPVLYLLHGGGQDHTAFMARRAFVPASRRLEMIVVMPAADRGAGSRVAGAQQAFETFLATELVQYVDDHYRTIATQQGRAIGGISMGGGLAAAAALRYPAVFGAVAALSAAFRGSAPQETPTAPPFFYVSCGTADSLLPLSRQLVQMLEAAKIPHEYRELPGRQHAWDVRDEQLVVFFDLLATRGGWRAASQR
jgi:S-formylglutathione hydrolase FrmB